MSGFADVGIALNAVDRAGIARKTVLAMIVAGKGTSKPVLNTLKNSDG